MERASVALVEMRYFDAERLAKQALDRSFAARDFDRMSRIVLPLLEARRQKRQLAVDATLGGGVVVLDRLESMAGKPPAGCYLFQPPLIGADAREFRERADAAKVAVFVLTREPMALDGKWPVVSLDEKSVRLKVAPPWPLARVEHAPTRDDSAARGAPSLEWFEAAAEALGDAAIAKVDERLPAAWQVEDFLHGVRALPTHEKLHQRLESACREALKHPLPEGRRERRFVDDPLVF